MSFLGKEYLLASQENFQEFLNATASALPAEVKATILSHKGTIKLEKLDDKRYKLTNSKPGGHKELIFTPGVPFDDDQNGIGPLAKTTITVDGNRMTSVTNSEGGKVLTITRIFSDNQVEVTMGATGFDGTVKRIYKA